MLHQMDLHRAELRKYFQTNFTGVTSTRRFLLVPALKIVIPEFKFFVPKILGFSFLLHILLTSLIYMLWKAVKLIFFTEQILL